MTTGVATWYLPDYQEPASGLRDRDKGKGGQQRSGLNLEKSRRNETNHSSQAVCARQKPMADGKEPARMGEKQVDKLLVERVQNGDKQAFDLLVLKYQHKIINLISRYINDAAETHDVAQEAFIKAYRAIGRFRGDSAFYTWLYRIAINTAKNHLVALSRRPPLNDIDSRDAEQFEGNTRLKDMDTPEKELLRDEIKQTIFSAISALPDDLKTAITLREMEGLSYEEIAEAMECPIGTVRSRIFRARDAIDSKLKPLIDETEEQA
jgi:RNA polymerase sigma-70 factor (ECF subfamily)